MSSPSKMLSHACVTQRTARVFQLGNFSSHTRYIWLACHGYAQTPEELLKGFEGLGSKHVVIAPEGFSRFYRKGFDGEVVSSWMTSRFREDEISDQLVFLNQVYTQWLAPNKHQNIKLIVFGFSQGVTTVYRWLAQARLPIDHLVLYAGSIPNDVPPTDSSIQNHYLLGRSDPFFEAYSAQEIETMVAQKLGCSIDWFDGMHEVLAPVMTAFCDRNFTA